MKLVKSKERLDKYKKKVKEHWEMMYGRNIWRTVHQAGSEEKNIALAARETEVFLFPSKDNVKTLLEDKEVNPRPTFGQFLDEHQPISNYLEEIESCVCLDYGCGSLARYTTNFAQLFGKVIGVDSSPSAIEYAKENYTKNLDNVELILSNGVDLSDVEDSSVDFVFSNLVFQHIGNKEVLVGIVEEISRVMAPGGVFRASFWDEEKDLNHESPQHGTGFKAPGGFQELFESCDLILETISWESPVVWITAIK